MIGRLLLLCALVALAIASLRTEPLQVSVAQQVTSTPTPTRTPTASPSATATASPTASRTATATATGTSTVTPTATATGTRTVGPTATGTASRTPTRTTTPTTTVTPTVTRTPTVTQSVTPTVTGTPTQTPTAVPPVISGVSVSSLTRSGATLSWTTNVPSTSQVDYGVVVVDSQHSALDSSLVTAHRVVLTGLLPGATYRYRVRSATIVANVPASTGARSNPVTSTGVGAAAVTGTDVNATTAAGAGVAISAEATLITAPAGSGPDITSLSVRLVTSSTTSIDWTTTTGTVAQVEYGPTANYGAFTLLNVFRQPTQEMTLTSLRPATLYHFRIKGWDGDGFLSASADSTFVTAPAGPATLIGDQVVQPERFVLPAGQAMAYQFAATSGQASLVRVFVDSGSTTPVLRVALYSDQDGAVGTILSQGSAPALASGWIAVSIPPVPLVQGTRYWVAVLSPVGSGNLNLRQAPTGGSSLSTAQTTLAAFPQVWAPGVSGAKSPLAVSVEQVPPAITLTGPADGSIVTGQADLSAVVDDDLPLARFQFLVDGLPVGPPLLSPPYVLSWDPSKYNAAVPHTISATATDLAGRTSTSAQVSVQVDHGPLITAVSMTAGLTATSARISWTTDVLADGAVEYGLSSAYGASTPVDARPDWRHEMQLTGLAPGAAYHYRVRSHDAYGALALSQDQVFFTPP